MTLSDSNNPVGGSNVEGGLESLSGSLTLEGNTGIVLGDEPGLLQVLRQSEGKYRALFEQSKDAIFIGEKSGRFIEVNQTCIDLFGYTRDELLGLDIYDLCVNDHEKQRFQALEQNKGQFESAQNGEFRLQRKDGKELYCLVSSILQRDSAGLTVGCHRIIHDITARKSLELQLFQAQKMESLGRLAGGIAHDFNNMLGGILGYASLLKSKLAPGTDNYEFAQIIENATQRGAQLVRQLLVTARKGGFVAKPLDVNVVVQEVGLMLAPILPEGIGVETRLQPELPVVQGDHNQIHQVLMNLCINAFDAMPEGGSLTLTTQKVMLDEEFCRQRLLCQTGSYIELSVTDTGTGIEEENRAKIFDPFFTTKDPNKGTGLGLSVVYAIVKNHLGMIEIDSVLGKGSTFRIYLPVFNQAAQ